MKLAPVRWPVFRMLAAAAIWAGHFGLVYGIVAIGCQRALIDALHWAIGTATLVAAAAALALIVAAMRGRRPREAADWMSAGAAGLALAAILWQASPLLWEQRCG